MWVEVKSTLELQVSQQLTMMAWFYVTKVDDWQQSIAKSNEYLLRIDPPNEGNKMPSLVGPGANWESRASARGRRKNLDPLCGHLVRWLRPNNPVEVGWGILLRRHHR